MQTATRYYVDGVTRAGGVPLVLPIVDPDDVPIALDAVDGLVLTGGGDVDPARYAQAAHEETSLVDDARDAFDLRVVTEAIDRRLPLLAACRGMQVVNVALGGSLVQHLPEHRQFERFTEGVHEVTVEAGSRLAKVLGTDRLRVNSLHHQAVCDAAPGLRAVAWATDGTVEAVERDDDAPLLAVQWHPELMEDDPVQQELFRELVRLATANARGRRPSPRSSPGPA